MNCTLRAANSRDASSLAAIDAAATQYPWQESQFSVQEAGGDNCFTQHILLAEYEELICGFIVYSTVFDEGEILNIAVRPAYQGKGVAGHMLAAVLHTMQGNAVQRCLLEVRASNTAARSLYQRFEFQLDGVRKNYYPAEGGREDALLMSKLISKVANEKVSL